MAEYTVPPGHIAMHAKTLAVNTQDIVTFAGVDLPEVEVLTNGLDDIYVRIGQGDATIGGTDCFRILAAMGSTVLPVKTSGDTVVKLISAAAVTYSVGRTN